MRLLAYFRYIKNICVPAVRSCLFLCVLLLLLVLISQWVRQTAQASTNTTLMRSIHYPPSVTVYTENNEIRIGYQSFSAALVICFNLVTCLVRQFFHLPLHKIHLSQTSVNVEPCINCIAWIFLCTKWLHSLLSFSIPVLAPPRSAYFACLSLLTHLIQIISSLEVCSVHERCSDWHAPYTGSIAPYTGSIAPCTGSIAPYTGSIAPEDWNWEPLP